MLKELELKAATKEKKKQVLQELEAIAKQKEQKVKVFSELMEVKGKKRRSWDQLNFEKFDQHAKELK